MRVICTDDTWTLARAQTILDRVGATVEFAYEVPAGDDIVGILTYPGCAIDASILERVPNLKVVATCSGGIDHLDVDGLAARGVACCNIRNFCDQEVADHTMALIYACLRGVVMLDGLVRGGSWWPYPQPPRVVRGARLGVVGFGTIGKLLIQNALGAGMEVLVVSQHATAEEIAAAGATKATLDEALETSDVVSLITSVTDATRGMIGVRELGLMRSDAYLVNTARAALIDHAALGQALEAGEIAGCALDALPVEPAPPEEPALTWPFTIVQPHAAFYSEASEARSFDNPAEDVARFLAGEQPLGLLRPIS
ncbi:MAG: NAD(P)-dependent oxidoreductase [Gaiellales bacterium]